MYSSLAENWFEENYTSEDRNNLIKSIKVFDASFLEAIEESGTISWEQYAALKGAHDSNHKIIIKCTPSGPFSSAEISTCLTHEIAPPPAPYNEHIAESLNLTFQILRKALIVQYYIFTMNSEAYVFCQTFTSNLMISRKKVESEDLTAYTTGQKPLQENCYYEFGKVDSLILTTDYWIGFGNFFFSFQTGDVIPNIEFEGRWRLCGGGALTLKQNKQYYVHVFAHRFMYVDEFDIL